MKRVVHDKLRFTNNILSIVVIAVFVYVMVFPLLPGFGLTVKRTLHQKPPLVSAFENGDDKPPNDNTLVIPRILLQEKINEGKTIAALRNGVWHRPNTSTPPKNSNTVIAGHRFTYQGQAVFYNLDKVKVDDQIVVYWDHQKYVYQVDRIKEVPPTALEVESSTPEARLTLYTCTPLWSAKNRLVVQAKLTEKPR